MPPQFCPISLTLFPSIKREGGKNIFRFDAHQRGTRTPHQVVLITAIRPSQRCMPMTSIIRPHGCRLMHSRQAPLSSTPLRESLTSAPPPHPRFTVSVLCSPSFPVLPFPFGASPTPHPRLCPFLPPPLFSYIHVPSSFPPVIRSWWPPGGVNGGENQP